MKNSKKMLLIGLLITLSGCSSKYAVTFDSNPQGAILVCSGKNWGYTPKKLYYDESVKDQSYLNVSNCSANWSSGVSANYPSRLTIYPKRGTLITLPRPNVTGYAQDAEFASKVRQAQAQQRQQARENYNLQQQQYNSYTYSPPKTNSYNYNNQNSATPVYNSNECVGAVVNGKCTGAINPNPSNVLRKKCYGTMINGECHGALGY